MAAKKRRRPASGSATWPTTKSASYTASAPRRPVTTRLAITDRMDSRQLPLCPDDRRAALAACDACGYQLAMWGRLQGSFQIRRRDRLFANTMWSLLSLRNGRHLTSWPLVAMWRNTSESVLISI